MTKAICGKRRNMRKRNQHRDVDLPIRRLQGLYDIPPEIILIVANQLAANSRTSLALACKGFFALICPDHKFPTMGKEDTVKLLLLLEKDAKRHYLCFGCLRLQPFERNKKLWSTQPHPICDHLVHRVAESRKLRLDWERRDCMDDVDFFRWTETVRTLTWKPAVRGPGGNEPTITFSEARLVMNRHFDGPEYGLPIDCLESTVHFDRDISVSDLSTTTHFPLEQHVSENRRSLRLRGTIPQIQRRLGRAATCLSATDTTRWAFMHKTTAKVIENELFLCRHHEILGPPCGLDAFTKVIDSLELPVCRHILGCSYSQSRGSSANACIPELHSLRIIATNPQWDVHPDRGIGSCKTCFTDYEITIKRGVGHRGWSLELTTYHKFGACRMPDDEFWTSLVGTYVPIFEPRMEESEFGYEYMYLYFPSSRETFDDPGTVRRAWLNHHGEREKLSKDCQPRWSCGLKCMVQTRFPRFSGPHRRYRKFFQSILDASYPGKDLIQKPGTIEYIGPY